MRQFQSIIVLKADDELFLLKSFHLRHSIQFLIINSSLIFKSSSRILFSVIDQIINNNIDFDSIESKQLKDVCIKITSNVLNKREQIHAIKKMFFNTTTFI